MQLEITEIKKENTEFKQRVSALENKLEQQEKWACSSMIEIRNVPKINNTNKTHLISIVENIGTAIKLHPPIQESEIRHIYQKKSEVLVVDFSSIIRKEALIDHFKKFNKNKREKKDPPLQTDQIHVEGPPRPIYLSDYLTTKTRHLAYLAREHVRNKVLAATWTSHGRVYLKKEENASAVRIYEEKDLLNL